MQLHIRRRDRSGISDVLAARVKRWEHEYICHGEAAESPCHEWECSFYLAWTPKKKRYALVLLDWGDTGSGCGYDVGGDEVPDGEVVGLMIYPPSCDENWIARCLLTKYWDAGGRYIEIFHRVGRFAIEDQEGQNVRLV